ncbi:hypothetical protein [Aeromonas veronii]|uniref:hypothetical protein n=1 Tax=Aeromonas veronii TaxID=654 RepID=UPI001D0A0A78|nr:hypothetical protein [Aeromonas veronii]MCC0090621.1 hypothetical protein [Aeromonas veronii]UZE61061.1 hypothetical protein ONR73_07580 [Aeromonas veronii]
MDKKDFFFGNIIKGKKGAELGLSDVINIADRVSSEFLTVQLNRLLKDLGGKVMLSDGTSYPRFWEFISKLEFVEIGFIEIYARMDMNDSVKATLACDIVLQEGIVSVVPQWCGYKEIRADEIVSTLLVPLHLKNLQGKTYLRESENVVGSLLVGTSYQDELEQVFALAKYPYAMDSGHKRAEYIDSLTCATNIAIRNLSPDEAWKAYVSTPTEN